MAKLDIEKIKEIIDSGEPVFFLRAKDAMSGPTLKFYAVKCEIEGSPTSHVDDIKMIHFMFDQWQKENPESVKQPD